MYKRFWPLALFIVLGNTYGQSSVDEYYEDASRLFHEDSYKAAIIQLKNALQQDPEHVPSLVLTAEAYIATDNSPAAEESLIKARVLGADRRFINLTLAEVYRRQGKYQSIIDELSIRNLPPQIAADLLGYKAVAWLSLGKNAKAQALIEQSHSLVSASFRTTIAEVLMALSQNQLNLAIELSRKLTEQYPQESEAWNTYASALHGSGNLQEALTIYQKSISLNPRFVDARISSAALAIDLERYQLAKTDLEYLRDRFPIEPRAAYLRGLLYSKLAATQPEFAKLSEQELKLCTEIMSRLPPDRVSADKQLPMVAAQAHYGLSEFEASKEYLALYLQKNDQDPGANKLMGDILIRLNDPVTAIKYLKPMQQAYPDDIKLTSLLATAYSESGHYDKATRLLSQLQRNNPGSNKIVSLMQSGHTNTGIEGLKHAYENSPQSSHDGFSLVVALLKNERYEEALFYAQQLLQSAPGNIAYLNLLGITQQSNNDYVAARQSFQTALDSNPNMTSVRINMAKLEMQQGNLDLAEKILKKGLEKEAESTALMLASAQLARDRGDLTEAIKTAEKARLADIEDLDTRLFLIDAYLQDGQFENAETLALDTNILGKGSFESNITLARVYQRTGKARKALSIYKQQAKQAGFHTERLYKLAQYMLELEALADARHALYKGLEGNSDHLPSLVSYISIQLASQEFEDARLRAESLVNKYPQQTIGYLLLGDSFIQIGQHRKAIEAYRQGLSVDFHPRIVLGLSSAYRDNNQPKLATKTLSQHWQQDNSVAAAYSVILIEEKRWQESEKILMELVKAQPNNPSHLNNLAYVKDQLGDKDAIGYARRAHLASPQNPYVNDTLGWLLVKSGNAEEGLKYLRQAVARATSLPELRYHLGKALLDLGRKAEAKRELRSALDSGEKFEGHAEAKKLLNSLS